MGKKKKKINSAKDVDENAPVTEGKEIMTEDKTDNTAESEDIMEDILDESQEEIPFTPEKSDDDQYDTLQQEIASLRQKVEENMDKAMRAQAELDNVRKRAKRDIEHAHKYALEKFLHELMPILDSMELGMHAADTAEDITSMREGIDLTYKLFADTMEKFGVRIIDPAGEKFDPELHEAVTVQEAEGTESGSVISVMQKGYELNGRLVRPALVIVAK